MTGLSRLAAVFSTLMLSGAPVWAADDDGGRQTFRIDFAAPPLIQVSENPASDERTFVGQIAGIVVAEPESLFADADVTCEFEGYAAPGRAFSCGFITVEQVSGRCLFTDLHGDAAVAEWSCRTGATMTSDARCEGRAEWVNGTGQFAGITGEVRLHSDLFLQPGKGFAEWKGRWRIATMAENRE